MVSDKIMVTRSSMPGIEEYFDEIASIWDTHWLTNMGPKHQELQRKLVEYLGVEKLDLFTNGHMAIELSLQALKLPKDSEVITTPFTFASTTHAIVRNGLKPVFCDIDPATFTIDAAKIETLITKKTSAILPVHVYGNVCDVKAIQSIAQKYGLKVLYDAAHAFGVRYRGQGIGSFGDVSCFSFHATKVFNTIEGGAACFRDENFGLDLYRLKNFGIRDPETVDAVGANAKMNEFCAAMGLCNLRHIEEDIAYRKTVVERYREQLEGVPGIRLNPVQPEVRQNYAYFPVIFDENYFGTSRDDAFKVLTKYGINTRKYFYPLTNSFDCYRNCFSEGDTPIAAQISRQVLTLPLYPDIPLKTVDLICEIILKMCP